MASSANIRRSPVPTETGTGKRKKARVAVQIARRLEDRILAEGWPIGFQIGREAELAVEMGVSRWTLREAVRILEASGFVAMRKGAGGGLFVASSAYDFVCKMAANYFEFVQVTGEEFGSVMRTLNRLAMTRAIYRVPDDEHRRIETQLSQLAALPLPQQLESAGGIHQSLVKFSGNPALVLYVGILGKLTFDACVYSTLDDEVWLSSFRSVNAVIADMASAVLAGRADQAQAASDALAAVFCRLFAASFLHLRMPITSAATQRAYDFFPPARPLKKVDGVERAIREMIFDEGWPVGSSLGSEKELAARFHVGRWVLREALRSLEQLGVIAMGRGSRSGVRVVSPDPTAVVETCRRYLRREGMSGEQARTVRDLLRGGAGPGDHPHSIGDLFRQILA